MQIRVYYEDTDFGGVVYHTNYLKYCERARSEMFFKNNTSPVINNAHFVVKKIECNFLHPAKFGDLLIVDTQIKTLKKASFILYHEIKKDNRLLFNATITLVLVKDNKIIRLNNEIINTILTLWEK